MGAQRWEAGAGDAGRGQVGGPWAPSSRGSAALQGRAASGRCPRAGGLRTRDCGGMKWGPFRGVSFAARWEQKAPPGRTRGGRSLEWKESAGGVEEPSLGAASAGPGGGKRRGGLLPGGRGGPPALQGGGSEGARERGVSVGEQHGDLG